MLFVGMRKDNDDVPPLLEILRHPMSHCVLVGAKVCRACAHAHKNTYVRHTLELDAQSARASEAERALRACRDEHVSELGAARDRAAELGAAHGAARADAAGARTDERRVKVGSGPPPPIARAAAAAARASSGIGRLGRCASRAAPARARARAPLGTSCVAALELELAHRPKATRSLSAHYARNAKPSSHSASPSSSGACASAPAGGGRRRGRAGADARAQRASRRRRHQLRASGRVGRGWARRRPCSRTCTRWPHTGQRSRTGLPTVSPDGWSLTCFVGPKIGK